MQHIVFFLTKRSLYALVADNRKDDADFNYWLNIVQMFAGNSPLLIVLNKKDDILRQINASDLRGRFPEMVKEIIAVNFKTKEEADQQKHDSRLKEIGQLIKYIEHYSSTMSHIGEPVPAKWVDVRNRLESDTRNFITYKEYLGLCNDEGISDEKDALLISGYFHDLGIVLHFQETDLLSDTLILKTAWATNAVYLIFDNDLIKTKQGRFDRNDICEIWNGCGYEIEMHGKLIEIMKKFRLIYEIGNTGNYIAPQLLPNDTPVYNWNAHENLNMVCEYDYFMPKGILSQLIVDLQPYIENHDLVWKTGVILRRENTYAEIKEDIQARKIFIRLAGHLKQQFTGIITDELDKINSMYHGLKTEKLIPCNCKLCSTSLSPQFFKLKEDLQQCLQHRVNDIRCNKSFENINILQLLGKVYDLGKPVSNLNDLVSLLEQIPKGSLNEKTAINLINIIGVNNIFKQDLLNGSMDFSASLDSLLYNEKLEEISSKLDDGFSEQSQRHDKQDKILEELNTKINACYLKFEKEIGNTERWNEIASLIIELNDNYEKASCEIVNQIFDWIDSNSEELKVYQLNLYNELKKTDNWKAKLKFGLPLAAVHGLDISVEGKVELNSLLKKISWKKDKH